jgi:hypothetical protein
MTLTDYDRRRQHNSRCAVIPAGCPGSGGGGGGGLGPPAAAGGCPGNGGDGGGGRGPAAHKPDNSQDARDLYERCQSDLTPWGSNTDHW